MTATDPKRTVEKSGVKCRLVTQSDCGNRSAIHEHTRVGPSGNGMRRTVLIALVGAVPATLLSVLAFLLAGVGSGLIAEGDIASGVFSLGYGLIAILGTISLWFAAFCPITLQIRLGLVGGVLTALPWLFVIARDGPGISDPNAIGLFSCLDALLSSLVFL